MNQICSENFFQEQIAKYNFAKSYCYGKTLEFSSNQFFAYHGAKILLENKCTTIIRYYLGNKKLFKRIIGDKSNIQLFKMEEDIDGLEKKSIDSIISFETKPFGKKFKSTMQKYYEFLKDDGIVLISVLNKDVLSNSKLSNEYNDICYTKEEFHSILESIFSEVKFFSQIKDPKNIPRTKVIGGLGVIRDSTSRILKKIDKNRSFYIKYLQSTMKKIDQKKDEMMDRPKEDFIPIKFSSEHNPFYFIAICKK